MSKRARITLNPEVDSNSDQDTEATPEPATEPDTQTSFTNAADSPPAPATNSKWLALNTGTIVKAVFVGLAAVSIVLLWKSRRP